MKHDSKFNFTLHLFVHGTRRSHQLHMNTAHLEPFAMLYCFLLDNCDELKHGNVLKAEIDECKNCLDWNIAHILLGCSKINGGFEPLTF